MDFTSCLPQEISEIILGWLTPRDVLSARCVSLNWRTLTERLIRLRASRGGPFLDLAKDETVPFFCNLPLFRVLHRQQIAHPSIAMSICRQFRHPLLAPSMRAKMVALAFAELDDQRKWPANLLNDQFLPKTLHVDLVRVSDMPKTPWRKVISVSVMSATLRELYLEVAEVAKIFPSCKSLDLSSTVRLDISLPNLEDYWPGLVSLDLKYFTMSNWTFPKSLKRLFLNNISFNVSSLDRTFSSEGFWSVLSGLESRPLVSLSIVDLPLLHSLELAYVKAEHVGLRTPNLKWLSVNGIDSGAWIDVSVLHTLEEAKFENIINIGDLEWLSPSLKVLTLRNVLLQSLNFLGHLCLLEDLTLTNVRADTVLDVPLHALGRLVSLSLHDGAFGCIDNPEDIGALSNLRALYLTDVHVKLEDLAWIQNLVCLHTLELCNIVDRNENRPEFGFSTLLGALTSLRHLRMRDICVFDFDLSETQITHAWLETVNVSRAALPETLKVLSISGCSETLFLCLQQLSGLRKLQYLKTSDQKLDVLGYDCMGSLKSVLFNIHSPNSDTNKTIRVDDVQLSFSSMPKMMPKISARSLILKKTKDSVFDLDFLDPLQLRSLELVDDLRRNRCFPSLKPVGACLLLEYLSIQFFCAVDLTPLAGHPNLREFDLHSRTDIDLTPLLTCPKLVAVNLHYYSEPPKGYDELMRYLQMQSC